MFQDLFVWHGRGSTSAERRAAVQYANELAVEGRRTVIEMLEGSEEQLFKDIMGEEAYASANVKSRFSFLRSVLESELIES